MILVRAAAVLVLLAIVLVAIYFVRRDTRYLKWAWRIFVAALLCMVSVLGFYFVERLTL